MRINLYKTMLSNERTPSLVKEKGINYETGGMLNNPEVIVEMLRDVFKHDKETEEVVYLICFDIRYKPVGVFEVSRGTVGSSVLNPREILLKALLCGAVSMVVAHNHPSGDATPSKTDIESSSRLKEAGNIVGIKLVDSLIVGEEQYYSLKEGGEL